MRPRALDYHDARSPSLTLPCIETLMKKSHGNDAQSESALNDIFVSETSGPRGRLRD
jgi:hypothetical protein